MFLGYFLVIVYWNLVVFILHVSKKDKIGCFEEFFYLLYLSFIATSGMMVFMIPLGKNELLSILDASHAYRQHLSKLSFPYTLTYFALVSILLPESGYGEVPLSKLIKYFNKSVQIANRQQLEKIGLLSVSRVKHTSPSIMRRLSIVLAPQYKAEGPGPNILQESDFDYIKLLQDRDMQARRSKWTDPDDWDEDKVIRLPRKWCRSYILDLLYRCFATENTVNQQQKAFLAYVSRCTQWRGRRLLAEVGRIRREWIQKRGAQHSLEVTMETIPTTSSMAKPHPLDRKTHWDKLRI